MSECRQAWAPRPPTPCMVEGSGRGNLVRLRRLTGRCDPPYGTAGIFRNQQCPVLVDGDADRAAPDFGIVDHEAGGEILVFARRRAVPHRYADDLVAGAFGAIPRAVLGGENTAAVLGRELLQTHRLQD